MRTTTQLPHPAPTPTSPTGDRLRTGVLVAAIITSGPTAGVFVDWSNAIMPGLREVDDRTFVETFRALDAAITSPLFVGVGYMGSLLLITVSGALHVRGGRRPALVLISTSFVCWLLMFAITAGVHEPLNHDLTESGAGEPEHNGDADYAAARALLDEAKWTAWNTVRAVASTVAFGSLVGALAVRRRLVRSRNGS